MRIYIVSKYNYHFIRYLLNVIFADLLGLFKFRFWSRDLQIYFHHLTAFVVACSLDSGILDANNPKLKYYTVQEKQFQYQ